MIDESQQDRAALYVLDLLEAAERSAFEADLHEDGKLQRLVSELRETAASLALSTPQITPSPDLKSRVMSFVDQTPEPPGTGSFLRPAILIPWSLAAGLAIVCFWVGTLYVQSRTTSSVLGDQSAIAEIEVTSARNELEAERILAKTQLAEATRELTSLNKQVERSTETIIEATRALGESYIQIDRAKTELLTSEARLAELGEQLAISTTENSELRQRLQKGVDFARFKIAALTPPAGTSSEPHAVAVWDPATRQGVLRIDPLPALTSDKVYQLWLIDPAYPSPVDAGVLTIDSAKGEGQFSFTAKQPVSHASKLAISVERKGGSETIEGRIVLRSE